MLSYRSEESANGIPLLKKGAINLFVNVPCPLKVTTRECLEYFIPRFNRISDLSLYSPFLFDGQAQNEEVLRRAQTEDELPEMLWVTGFHVVLSKAFKERFIDTHVYVPVLSDDVVSTLPPFCQRLVKEQNIGLAGMGFWSVVCDTSLKIDVPYPRQWTDLVNPIYRGLISIHGCNGRPSIAALLLLLKERLGDQAIVDLGKNIRNIWHFSEILKRLDSNDPRRAPLNILPNAASVHMPSRKRGAILEFEEGPLLTPMLLYVKASRKRECQPIIDFIFSKKMRENLHQGDFCLVDEFDWKKKYCFPKWDDLLQYDYEELCNMLSDQLCEGLGKEILDSIKLQR